MVRSFVEVTCSYVYLLAAMMMMMMMMTATMISIHNPIALNPTYRWNRTPR